MADDKTDPPNPAVSRSADAPPISPADEGAIAKTGTNRPPVTSAPLTTTVTTGMLIAGTYEIERLINRGGMGEVYRARNIHTGDPVAMKIVLPALAHDPMIEALFQKEAKVLGRLAHDAIVRYHTYMNPPEIGRPSLIMEFVEGRSLSDRIKEGPMPEAQVRVLIRRLASGLDRAHGAGVVHRDLSPDNVILEGEQVEHAKLIDFGIAKSSMQGDRTLLQGQFAGKFAFVAPEQLGAYDGAIDGRTDIYSLALLMVAALRGKTLNMGNSIIEAVRSRSSVPDLADMPGSLRPLLEHMLQPDPAHRPASMAQVIAFLDDPSLTPPQRGPDTGFDPDRTVIAAALPKADLSDAMRATASGTTAAPARSAVFTGIPGDRPDAAPVAKPRTKTGLYAVLAVLLLAAGGSWAYFSGIIPPLVPLTGSVTAKPDTGKVPVATTSVAKDVRPDTPEFAATRPAADEQAQPDAAKLTAAKAADAARAASAQAAAARTAADQAARDKAALDAAAKDTAAKDAAAKDAAAKPLDRLGQQLALLKTYDAGACAFVALRGTEGDAVQLEGFGTTVDPFSTLRDALEKKGGPAPDLNVRLVKEAQCPVIDFMKTIVGNQGIMPSLVLDSASDVLKSGETVSGHIDGLAGRAVSLFLVNGAGGSTNLKPWMSRSSDGVLGFSFTVSLAAGADPTPQLILAVVTERAVEKLDAVPNGVTARALVPFMQSELARNRQTPIGALRFFRLEN